MNQNLNCQQVSFFWIVTLCLCSARNLTSRSVALPHILNFYFLESQDRKRGLLESRKDGQKADHFGNVGRL